MQALTAVRLDAGLTQSEMATLMCTSQTTIAKWENGRRYPTLTTLEKIAEVTGRRLELRFV
jgi:transcriptional regulator with XRE-family HTH domain